MSLFFSAQKYVHDCRLTFALVPIHEAKQCMRRVWRSTSIFARDMLLRYSEYHAVTKYIKPI